MFVNTCREKTVEIKFTNLHDCSYDQEFPCLYFQWLDVINPSHVLLGLHITISLKHYNVHFCATLDTELFFRTSSHDHHFESFYYHRRLDHLLDFLVQIGFRLTFKPLALLKR